MSVEITNAATQVMLNLVLGVITLLGALGTYYLQKATQKLQVETVQIKDEAARNYVNAALKRLDDVTEKTVNKIEQTTKKEVLAAIDAGTVHPDKIKDLALDAYNEIIKTLEPDYMQVIQDTMGDAQTYIMNLIEKELEELKSQKSTSLLQPLISNTVTNANSDSNTSTNNAPDSNAGTGENSNIEPSIDVLASNTATDVNPNIDSSGPSKVN